MPRINPSDDVKAYGSAALDQRLSFRERLMNRFSSHEWVRVINIDDEPFRWQYLPTHAEEFEFTPDPMKITRREDVELYELKPGESEVLPGENAYVMLEGLYKKLVSKNYTFKYGDNKPGSPGRNFNWNDGQQQEEIIDRIYLGKENPKFNKKVVDVPPAVDPATDTTAPSRLR